MHRSTLTAYRAFRALADATQDTAPLPAPLRAAVRHPPPYQPCACGSCPQCRDNAKWDRIFAKFEVGNEKCEECTGARLEISKRRPQP